MYAFLRFFFFLHPSMTKGTHRGSSGVHTTVLYPLGYLLIPHSFAATFRSRSVTCSWFSGSNTEGCFSGCISMRWALNADVRHSLHSLNPQRDYLKGYSWGELAKN